MRPILLAPLALLLLVAASACSTGSAAAPEPTPPAPDVPTFTQMEVWAALRAHVVQLQHKADHRATVGCIATEADYQGFGIWHCGNWVLNERTLDIVRDDGSTAGAGQMAGHHQ